MLRATPASQMGWEMAAGARHTWRVRPQAYAAMLGLFGLVVLTLPTAALGMPIQLWFDGPSFGGSLPIGVSEEAALSSGLTVYDETLTDPTGLLAVTSQVLDDASIVWPLPPSFVDPVQATSDWTAEAQVGLEGRVLMIFVTTTDDEYLGLSGLEVDASDGWVLVRSQLAGEDVYFPAVDLGLLPTVGATAQTQIHYLAATDLKWDPVASEYLLPQLMMAVTTVTASVPEPGGTGLMVLASALLALRLRRAV